MCVTCGSKLTNLFSSLPLLYQDMSEKGFEALPELKELTAMKNVIVSSHVAFYTDESIRQITEKTLSNFEGFEGNVEMDEKAFVA